MCHQKDEYKLAKELNYYYINIVERRGRTKLVILRVCEKWLCENY